MAAKHAMVKRLNSDKMKRQQSPTLSGGSIQQVSVSQLPKNLRTT